MVHRINNFLQLDPWLENEHLSVFFSYFYVCVLYQRGIPFSQGIRLTDFIERIDANHQGAMRNGGSAYSDSAIDHCRSRSRIDNHASDGLARVDLHLLDITQESNLLRNVARPVNDN